MPEQTLEAPVSGIQRIHQIQTAYNAERVLSAATQLDVFSAIAAGRRTGAEIAEATGASERGMTMLLDALAGIEILEKRDGDYHLSAEASQYLDRQSPEYMGAMFQRDFYWNAWGRLAEAVRQGKPALPTSDPAVAEEFYPVLIRTLHVVHREPAQRLAQALTQPATERGAHRRHGLRVLDIGCGSAVWSCEIAKADSEATVTAIDYPAVLDLTQQYVARETLLDRYTFSSLDLREAEFLPNSCDLAILAHVAHGESERTLRDLFTRVHHALTGGGRIVIVDVVPNDERTGPLFSLIFALNMLLLSDEGDAYTFEQYGGWLGAAGLGRFETVEIGTHSPAIVATKVRS